MLAINISKWYCEQVVLFVTYLINRTPSQILNINIAHATFQTFKPTSCMLSSPRLKEFG